MHGRLVTQSRSQYSSDLGMGMGTGKLAWMLKGLIRLAGLLCDNDIDLNISE